MPDFDSRLATLADLAGRAARVPLAGEIRRRAHQRTVRRRTAAGVFAVVVLAGGVLGGMRLQAPDDSVTVTPSPSATVSPLASPSADPTVAPSAAPPTSPPPAAVSASGECMAGSLSVTLGARDAGLGHRSVELVFRNIGTTSCRMHGYPGVDGLAADGSTIAQAARTMSGYMGGIRDSTSQPTATLRPGQSTIALVEGTASTSDGSACEGIKQLLVTAPNDTVSTKLSWDTDVCGNFQVHPIMG